MRPANQPNSELSNKENSPLLRLPGELRNHIYSYLLNDEDVGVVYKKINTVIRYPRKFNSLPQVSRQLHYETLSNILSRNTVWLKFADLDKFFQACTSSELSLIREVILDFSYERDWPKIGRECEKIASYMKPLCAHGTLKRILFYHGSVNFLRAQDLKRCAKTVFIHLCTKDEGLITDGRVAIECESGYQL